MKTLLLFSLFLIVNSCNNTAPTSESQAVADKTHTLSLENVSTASQDTYHFQVCKKEIPSSEATTEEAGKKTCFNPFYATGDEPATFTAIPEVESLHTKGKIKKILRHTVNTSMVVVFGSIALVVIPKAARIAFNNLLSIKKGSDEMIKKAFPKKRLLFKSNGKEVDIGEVLKKHKLVRDPVIDEWLYKEQLELIAKGKDLTEDIVVKKYKKYDMLKSKPMRFLISLFIVDGIFEGWDILKMIYQGLSGLTNKWGKKDLEAAEIYPYLLSDTGEIKEIESVKDTLQALKSHLGLVFSDAYHAEFETTSNQIGF